jgi:hypothetical protein
VLSVSRPAAMTPCDETSDHMEPMDLAALNRWVCGSCTQHVGAVPAVVIDLQTTAETLPVCACVCQHSPA